MRQLPERMPDSNSGQAFDIAVARLVGAEELARGAALADAEFQPLADALHEAQQLLNRTFDPQQMEPAIKQARTYC
ncbi:hypothetical protein [Kitasatospora sp. NPDC057198]|uniref:hypothetical protein n=1 Tax=Kitasatospora sp. NPDC057198 TaxID=3346046 RepID=UPI00363DFDAB